MTVHATITEQGHATVDLAGQTHNLQRATVEDARDAVIQLIGVHAAAHQAPVQITAEDPSGNYVLSIQPDGTVSDLTRHPTVEQVDTTPPPQPTSNGTPSQRHDGPPPGEYLNLVANLGGEALDLGQDHAPTGPSHDRPSFISQTPATSPAVHGWRGALSRVGIRLKPSKAEQAHRNAVAAVSQHWPGPRTIAVVNPKGGANKTPTAVCLASVFARYGGAGVLAWDNNETRGTLPWRVQPGPHESTVLNLLQAGDRLLGPDAQAAQLASYVHHQPADKYDALWSDQNAESTHQVTAAEVDLAHQVASKYYRLTIIDSGNSERAANWQAMIGHSHVLVVPCTTREDSAENAARMLEALHTRGYHAANLATKAVVIVSQPGKSPNLNRIADGFAPLVRAVVTIPYDPALESGHIAFDALKPATRTAWLRAAAAVAHGL